MFIRKEHTELFDEMFQFPKSKHDDLLDGLWYACINSRAPLSRKFNATDFKDNKRNLEVSSKKELLIG